MRVSTLFVIAAVVAVAAASSLAAASPMVTHHADLERAERLGWTRAFRSAPDQVVNMRFAVRQKNMDRVHALVAEVSDPKNAKYGQHLSFAEVGELTRDQLASALLSSFLRTNGAKDVRVSKNHDWVWATCTVAVAEQMFSTEFHAFARDNQLVHRALHITLPAHIADTFEYVSGVHNFHQRYSRHAVFGASRLRSNTATKVGAGQFGDVYPQVLEKYSGCPSATITAPRGSVSVFEALGQSYAPADLTTFETSYGVGQGENVVDVIGPNTPSACTADPNNCGEASLDVQVVVGCAPGVPLTFWSIDQSVQDIFGEWIAAVANDDSAPLVHSISYGGDESGEDTGSLQRFNDEVMKLALRGITVIASSGDDGAPGSDGRGGQCPATTMPAFPASAPAVTAVGASMGIENDQPEAACLSQSGGLISTGAGFSNVFATPSWQSSQVSQYLNSGVVLPSSTAFNASGHAYPHVVMAGHNYETIIAGQVSVGSGTSASAPAFASAVALANEARLAAGKSALGYLNPFLYGTVYGSDATNAVQTAGVQNNCCAGQTGTQNCCAGLGFSGTTSGWNPLAGIGSINVPKFIKLALSV